MKTKAMTLKTAILLFLCVNGLVLAQGENLKVGEIKVSQLQQLPEDFILSKIPVKSGDSYTNKDISDIYLALKRLNYIYNVNVYPEINGNTVDLRVEVDERANALELAKKAEAAVEMTKKTDLVISSVDIEGLSTINKDQLLSATGLKVGEYFVPQGAVDGASKIFKTGQFASVEPKVIRKDDNTISITYIVQENPPVKSVTIKGNTLFSAEELVKASKLEVGKVLNGNLLDPDSNGILDYYVAAGYPLARVETIAVDPTGDIEIAITEGIVNSVSVRKASAKKENTRKNEYNSKLRTKQYVFDRVQEVKPGEVFQKKNIENTIRELYRTGIFTSIEPVFTTSEKDPNVRNIELLVEERPTASINGSISYGTEVGLVGGIKLADSNFMGKGQEASLNIEASNQGNKTVELSLFDPWIRGTERVQGGGSIYWREMVDENAKAGETEKVKRYGTRWTVGKGLNSNIFARASVRFDNYKEYYKDGILADKYNLVAITPSLVYDTRNNSYNPTKGIYATLSYERGKLFSRQSYIGEEGKAYDQFEADLRAYHPTFFGDKNIMAYRAVWGRTGSGTPSALRYSVGGSESIRGYEAGDFDGFDKFHATIENRTQINKALQFVTFFDIGNAWQGEVATASGLARNVPDRKSAGSFKDLKKGYGIGLRLETPMGPLRFDYGWPMDPITKGKEKTGGKFYFSFGQTF